MVEADTAGVGFDDADYGPPEDMEDFFQRTEEAFLYEELTKLANFAIEEFTRKFGRLPDAGQTAEILAPIGECARTRDLIVRQTMKLLQDGPDFLSDRLEGIRHDLGHKFGEAPVD